MATVDENYVEDMQKVMGIIKAINAIRSRIVSGSQMIVNAAILGRTTGKDMFPFDDEIPVPGFLGEWPDGLHLWKFVVQIPDKGEPYLSYGINDADGYSQLMTKIDGLMSQANTKEIITMIGHDLFPRLLSCIAYEVQGEMGDYGDDILRAALQPTTNWEAFIASSNAPRE